MSMDLNGLTNSADDGYDTHDTSDTHDTYDTSDAHDTSDTHDDNRDNREMTAYKCIRKIMKAGGSYELLADGNIKLHVPPTAECLISYVYTFCDDIKVALRVQLWQQPISDTDLLAGWKRAMAAGMLDAIKVRLYPDRDYMEIDYIQLDEHEEIFRIFYPENFE